MSTTILEHRVALAHAAEPFSSSERAKACRLLRRLRRLQFLHDNDRANPHTEAERAALLWALKELGVICGKRLERRHKAADLRCVRPDDHPGACDGRVGGEK
jgi:hypothetical protein